MFHLCQDMPPHRCWNDADTKTDYDGNESWDTVLPERCNFDHRQLNIKCPQCYAPAVKPEQSALADLNKAEDYIGREILWLADEQDGDDPVPTQASFIWMANEKPIRSPRAKTTFVIQDMPGPVARVPPVGALESTGRSVALKPSGQNVQPRQPHSCADAPSTNARHHRVPKTAYSHCLRYHTSPRTDPDGKRKRAVI